MSKINWKPFYNKSSYRVESAICGIATLDHRKTLVLSTQPTNEAYLLVSLIIKRDAPKPAESSRYDSDSDEYGSMYDDWGYNRNAGDTYFTKVLVDVHNDRWVYVDGHYVVNWPKRFALTQRDKETIYKAAKAHTTALLNEPADG